MIPSRLDEWLRDIDPRIVPLTLLAILGIGVFLALQYGIKPAYASYSQLRQEHERAKANLAAESRSEMESISSLEEEIRTLERELNGDSAAVPREEIESFVVNSLDRISSRHGIELLGITPDEPDAVLMFEELPYAVEVEGSYFAVHRWLYDVEAELRPMVVKQFELMPSRDGNEVKLALRIVAYRATEENGT